VLIVGELINASRKAVGAAIETGNPVDIEQLAVRQSAAGADYIDVNAGMFVGREAEYLQWLVSVVQAVVDAPCCIDSPDPAAIERALHVHRGTAMINSISLEKARHDALLPLVAGSGVKVVALCMSDEGMPATAADRLTIAERLIEDLVRNNVALDDIYVDPLVQPVATRDDFGLGVLKAVDAVMTGFPGVHTICGLSNISYGLPERALLNRTFAVMAVARGLDSLIVNPLDRHLMANLTAARTLAGGDEFCEKYLDAYRAGLFDFEKNP